MIQFLHIIINKKHIKFYADGEEVPAKFLVGQSVNVTIVTEILDEKSGSVEPENERTTNESIK